jgi:hypothetical protein
MDYLRRICRHLILNGFKQAYIDERSPSKLNSYWGLATFNGGMTRPSTPYQCSTVCFIGKNLVDGCFTPALFRASSEALSIESSCNFFTTVPFQSHIKNSSNALNSNRILRFGSKFVPRFDSIGNCHFALPLSPTLFIGQITLVAQRYQSYFIILMST